MMLIHKLLFNRKLDEANPDGGDGGGGQAAPSFLDGFDSDTRVSLEKAGISDAAGLAKQWADAQSYIGSSIRVPSQEAGEEDRKAFYEKIQKHAPDLIPRPDSSNPDAMNALWAQLGRPEAVDGYQLPEGVTAEQIGDLTKYAHEANLTDNQFQTLVSKMAEQEKTAAQAAADAFNADQQALKQEWGLAYEQNVQTVARLAEQTGAPEAIVAAAKEGKLDASVAKWMHSLTTRLGKEGAEMVQSPAGERLMTKGEASAQLDEIYANPQHPYHNMAHPSHKQAVKRVVELTAAMSGKKAPEIAGY